jgi:hypothetical protein
MGEVRLATGATDTQRSGPYGDQIMSELQGRYFELARYSRIYHTFVKTVTVAATHNTPIAAATATPVLGLHNPLGSGRAAVILRIATGTVSGTPAGGQFVLNAIQTTTAPTTVAGSIFNGLLSASGSAQGSVIRTFNNTALTGMLPVVGNEIALVGQASAAAAAGNGGPGIAGEDIGGAVIVTPTFLLALMAGTGAGTTWIVNASITWAEIDWPL